MRQNLGCEGVFHRYPGNGHVWMDGWMGGRVDGWTNE